MPSRSVENEISARAWELGLLCKREAGRVTVPDRKVRRKLMTCCLKMNPHRWGFFAVLQTLRPNTQGLELTGED